MLQSLQAFILVGAAQGYILSAQILSHSKNRNIDFLLTVALFALSFRLTLYPFQGILQLGDLINYNHLSLTFLLLTGPSLFLYICSRIRTNFRLRIYHLVHLIPFCFYSIHVFFPFYEIPGCYTYSTLYSGMIYGISAIFMTYFHSMRKRCGNIRLYFFAFPLFAIPTLIYSFSFFDELFWGLHPATFPYLIVTALLYRMSYGGLRDSKKFFRAITTKPQDHSILNLDNLGILKDTIENNRLYLNPDISIVDLVLQTGISRHEISHLINKGMSTKFNELMNQYRVNEAMKQLINTEFRHYTVFGIAQQCGFKSKTTFYQEFKKSTGKTPSEYQRLNLK